MTAPSTYFKVTGDWKRFTGMNFKVEGEWVNIPRAYTKVAGEWKLIFQQSQPSIIPDGLNALIVDFDIPVIAATYGEGAVMALLGSFTTNWGANEAYTYVSDGIGGNTTTTPDYTTIGFPMGGQGSAAATSTGLVAFYDYLAQVQIVDPSDGSLVHSESVYERRSNLLSSEDGCVYFVRNDAGGGHLGSLAKINAGGTVSVLEPYGGAGNDEIILLNLNANYIYGYFPATGALHTLDPIEAEHIVDTTTIGTGYTSLALAGDGSIWGLVASSAADPHGTRVYRNDVLVYTGDNPWPYEGGITNQICRNWATGEIVLMEGSKYYVFSADGATRDVGNTGLSEFVAVPHLLHSHPNFPDTIVASTRYPVSGHFHMIRFVPSS